MTRKLECIRGKDYYPDPDWPIAVVTEEKTRKGIHTHDCCELIIMHRGRARHHVAQQTYGMTSGDIFLVQGEQQHWLEREQYMLLSNVLYNPEQLPLTDQLQSLPGYRAFFMIEPAFRQHRRFTSQLHLTSQDFGHIEKLVWRIAEETKHGTANNRIMSATLLQELLVTISRCYMTNSSNSRQSLSRLAETLQAMEERCTDEWDLEDILSHTGLSKSTCMRHFREATGTSPIDYLIQLRIRHAMRLLTTTRDSITAVAMASGFNDSNYFTRQFVRVMGISPSQWLAQTQNTTTR